MPTSGGSATVATIRKRFAAKGGSLGASVHLADTEAAATCGSEPPSISAEKVLTPNRRGM
jgi:hypothetical protein